ncbi:MAG: hypothetical protein K6G62_05715, partial [Eubacterium sp.]|nr:hypothetical protein [Eubacterium sp.]
TTYYEKIQEGVLDSGVNIKAWEVLDDLEKKIASAFAERRLKEANFEVYIHHAVDYMDQVDQELQALGGGLLVVRSQGGVIGVANTAMDQDEHLITELICQSGKGQVVLEAVLEYLHADKITVEDSYFIQNLQGDHVTQIKQKKPYIMAKYTNGRKLEPFFCYINDIT